jgi:hypothetical protein
MTKKEPVVITLTAGKTPNGTLHAFAEPDPAVIHAGELVKWVVVAYDGVRNVKPDHFRPKATWMDSVPFNALRRKRTKKGAVTYVARSQKSGLIRTYKYDIVVDGRVVEDPDIQIHED